MDVRWFMRAWIALEFVGMVTVAVIYVGGVWSALAIVGTGTVVFGLVGGHRGGG